MPESFFLRKNRRTEITSCAMYVIVAASLAIGFTDYLLKYWFQKSDPGISPGSFGEQAVTFHLLIIVFAYAHKMLIYLRL